ncbi:MAG: Flp pilus assembly complex ATPase component TadA [Gammaproteobacteria bacterium]|nr:Flp pilus assembly complex ATPase component TadA [Gammaproteobacteria bacterium]
MQRKLDIGDFLINKKIITKDQLEKAKTLQETTGKNLKDALLELGFIKEAEFLKQYAELLGIPYVDLAHYSIQEVLAHQLPESYARRFKAILLKDTPDGYFVGMVNPLDIFAIDEISRVLDRPIKLALVNEPPLLRALDLIYRRTGEISNFAEQLETELKSYDLLSDEEAQEQADTIVIRLIHSLFEDAVQVNATDIHIEPAEKLLRVRLRVDGVLQEQTMEEKRIASALSQRLKLMAGLNMAEKRLPQDGRFTIRVRDMQIDVRLSTMPVQYGESIVMRLLNQSGRLLTLDEIGMSPEILSRFREFIKIPWGMILVTGPTGSGKTTTLYGGLSEINDIRKKIITIEDPVEYRLEHLNQIQIRTQLGLTFSRVLRSALRQDPDIILLGEIRDEETATIALRAALTGHLVLTTLHTNDAKTASIRLIDMGAKSYMVAATIRAVLAQRLVRRVCSSCAEPYQPTAQEMSFFENFLGKTLDLKKVKFVHGKGCNVCSQTGYKGRIGVFELLELDEAMIDALRRNDTADFMKRAEASLAGKTLLHHAYQMAAKGLTTLDEILRVIFNF